MFQGYCTVHSIPGCTWNIISVCAGLFIHVNAQRPVFISCIRKLLSKSLTMEACQPMAEDTVARTVIIFQHLATLIILILLIWMAYKTAELRHPVYALLYQELVVLAIFASLSLLDLLFMIVTEEDKNSPLTGIYFFIDIAALQLHQITCLSVACLR